MTLVLDSSAVVALLLDSAAGGDWVAGQLDGQELAAPDLMGFEVANVLRRLSLSGHISDQEATLANVDLLDLPVSTWPYSVLARPIWELRGRLTAYDASYVAVARLTLAPLLTLDQRVARSGVTGCEIRCPTR